MSEMTEPEARAVVARAYDALQARLHEAGAIQFGEILGTMEPALQAAGYRAPHAGPMRLLVLRLDDIGDNVLMSPFLRELRRDFPQAEIDLMVKPSVLPLVELCPYVDHVYAADGAPVPGAPMEEYLRWMRALCERVLWARRYDGCLMPRWDADELLTAILSYLCGARERIGYSPRVHRWREMMDRGNETMLTRALMTPPYVVHEVEKNLYFLKALGRDVQSDRLELWLSQTDAEAARRRLPHAAAKGYIAVAVGTREQRKVYPVEKLAKVLEALLDVKLPFVLLGGKGEEAGARRIEKALPRGSVVNLVGRLPLRESAAIVSECRLYLGGDTGLTHIAAAAKRPIVEWFAHPMDVPVSVVSLYARFFPWKANVAALRPEHALPGCEQLERGFAEITGCHSREKAHCIAAIPPKQIAGAAQTMLRMK